MHYTYVLQSNLTSGLYVGSTGDLRKRLIEHNSDKVKTTKNRGPWIVLYYEAHRNKTLALKAEKFYKKSQGRRQLSKKLDLPPRRGG